MTSPVSIRAYSPKHDSNAVYALWQTVFVNHWPLTPVQLDDVITGHGQYLDGDHSVAERTGRIVGFVGTQTARGTPNPNTTGGISVLMVDPTARRRGVGRSLHAAALSRLRNAGVVRARLGGGGTYRFWPGVPAGMAGAEPFLRSCGWRFSETAYDLVQNLRGYRTPSDSPHRFAGKDTDIRVPSAAEIDTILEFEAQHFPTWLEAFQHIAGVGALDDILAAWAPGAGVIGSLLMFTRTSRGAGSNRLWKTVLGEDMGGLGAVGVAETERGRGVGTALVARATEILKHRGVRTSYVGWTSQVGLYGDLGYTKWRQYDMSARAL